MKNGIKIGNDLKYVPIRALEGVSAMPRSPKIKSRLSSFRTTGLWKRGLSAISDMNLDIPRFLLHDCSLATNPINQLSYEPSHSTAFSPTRSTSSDRPISSLYSQPQSRKSKEGARELVASPDTRDCDPDSFWDRERKG